MENRQLGSIFPAISAKAVAFLVSADASYISGQTLVVDGGMAI